MTAHAAYSFAITLVGALLLVGAAKKLSVLA